MNQQIENHLIDKVDKIDKNINTLLNELKFHKALEFAEEFIEAHELTISYMILRKEKGL